MADDPIGSDVLKLAGEEISGAAAWVATGYFSPPIGLKTVAISAIVRGASKIY
jgi:hypothetical protein